MSHPRRPDDEPPRDRQVPGWLRPEQPGGLSQPMRWFLSILVMIASLAFLAGLVWVITRYIATGA